MSSSQAPADFQEGSSLWLYDPDGNPNRPAAIVLFVLLGLSTILHIGQLCNSKLWKVMFLMPWAGLLYTSGYVTRFISSYYNSDLGIFLATTLLVFLAPPIYAAVNYFILGRALGYIPYVSPIHPGRVVTTFIALDVAVEVITANGAWRLSRWDMPNERASGLRLMRAALILLLALYCCFVILQVVFHRRCIKAKVVTAKLRRMMNVLYLSNVFHLIRNIYRVVEIFVPGDYIHTHEWCFYLFEAVPMILNSILLNVFYPALFLPRDNRLFLCHDGFTERRGPGWRDKRPFILTLVDPFDIFGIVTGKDNKNRYWDQEEDWPVDTDEDKAAAGRRLLESSYSERPFWGKIIDPFNVSGRLTKNSDSKSVDGQKPDPESGSS